MIRCVKFRPFVKNTLQGFCSFELTRVGIVVHDCTLHRKGDREWIAFPARSYELDGTTRWSPILEFGKDAERARDQFRQQAVEAVRAFVAAQGGGHG